MQGRFLKSYNLAVKQMGGIKVHKKKSRGREKHEIQTGQWRFVWHHRSLAGKVGKVIFVKAAIRRATVANKKLRNILRQESRDSNNSGETNE